MAEVDKKKIFNKTKHDLESWREIILHLSSVLRWEQSFYPGVIFGAVTFIHIFLWYLDLSLLTLWSLILLLVTLVDFVYPMVSKFVFKPENWTGTHEKSYELIIQDLVDAKLKLCGAISYACTSKTEKSTLYLVVVSVSCLLGIWIGSTFDNLFLTYVGTLAITLYPGLSHKGLIKIVTDQVNAFISTHIKKIKPDKTE